MQIELDLQKQIIISGFTYIKLTNLSLFFIGGDCSGVLM